MTKVLFKMAELSPGTTQEMENALPGEVREFIDGDDSKSYTLLSDGTVNVQTISEYVDLKSICKKLLNPSKVIEIYEKVKKLERYRSDRNPKRGEGSYLFEVIAGDRKVYIKVLKNDLPKFPEVNSFTASTSKAVGRVVIASLGLDTDDD